MKNLRDIAEEFWDDHSFLEYSTEAEGRCFWSVLAFASFYAVKQQYPIELIRWAVTNDKYCDHWAVKVDDRIVFDFTRAQVDGKSGFVFDINTYPSNYRQRRIYPASLFLKDLDVNELSVDGQISAQTMRKMRINRLQHDRECIKQKPWGVAEWCISIAGAFWIGWKLLS